MTIELEKRIARLEQSHEMYADLVIELQSQLKTALSYLPPAKREAIKYVARHLRSESSLTTTVFTPKPIKLQSELPMSFPKTTDGLFNLLLEITGAETDAELADMLEVAPPMICNMRSGRLNVGSVMIVKINEISNINIADIKSYLKRLNPLKKRKPN